MSGSQSHPGSQDPEQREKKARGQYICTDTVGTRRTLLQPLCTTKTGKDPMKLEQDKILQVETIERFHHVITIPYTRNEPPSWCTTCTVCY